MKNFQSVLVALLVVLLVGVVFSEIEVVKAEPIIYIRSDGSVEGTDKIEQSGDVYTFLDVVFKGIQIQRSNIVVDGAGHTLQGDGEVHGPHDIVGMGIEVLECSNVTIKNLKITQFTRGIRFTNASECEVCLNVLSNNSIGVELGGTDRSHFTAYSTNNRVIHNIINEDHNVGVMLYYGSSNNISHNVITSNNHGVYIMSGGSENSITWNNITDNTKGVYVESSGVAIHHNNFVGNTYDWWDYGLTPWPFQLPFFVNVWDDGTEGNYWSRYDGTDTDGDGIGDTPHYLYENNTDNHPLMAPVELEVIPEFPTLFIVAAGLVVVTVLSTSYKLKMKQRKKR
ncbi:MAG: hypothetical protein CW716_08320 [Candidatus Bathyarchaeum sp.]|nr:MAG: hypothetical protein CW716_08320 [Candidatus Bathyarchaeum sp.]